MQTEKKFIFGALGVTRFFMDPKWARPKGAENGSNNAEKNIFLDFYKIISFLKIFRFFQIFLTIFINFWTQNGPKGAENG